MKRPFLQKRGRCELCIPIKFFRVNCHSREDSTSCKMMQYPWKRDPETRPRRQKQQHEHANDANCTTSYSYVDGRNSAVPALDPLHPGLPDHVVDETGHLEPASADTVSLVPDTKRQRLESPLFAHQTSAPDPSRPWLDASLRVLRQAGLTSFSCTK